MLEFNVPGGKLNRGMAVLDVLKAIKGTEVSVFVAMHKLAADDSIACMKHVMFSGLQQITREEAFKANALGWCIEWVSKDTRTQSAVLPAQKQILCHYLALTLSACVVQLQAFFLVSDDIMDNSVTRRGQPCWYRMPEVSIPSF